MQIATLRALYPMAPPEHLAAIAANGDAVFARFDVRPGRRMEFLLAQAGHESGGLSMTTENLNYSVDGLCKIFKKYFPNSAAAQACARQPERIANRVYADRMGNGNEASGDGWRYRGRGYIQLTGREAYREVGEIAGVDLEKQPELAIAPQHALAVTCAFWRWKNLNALCDGGDYTAVTRRINGGTNGMEDRLAWLDKVRRVMTQPPGDAQEAVDIVAVQRALQRQGYTELGAADGQVGPRTLAAVKRYRDEHGLPEGGIDAVLVASLALD